MKNMLVPNENVFHKEYACEIKKKKNLLIMYTCTVNVKDQNRLKKKKKK
jgi:hypothetical protein